MIMMAVARYTYMWICKVRLATTSITTQFYQSTIISFYILYHYHFNLYIMTHYQLLTMCILPVGAQNANGL